MAATPAPGRPSLFAATLGRIGLLPWVRIRGGTLHVTLPEWWYDVLGFVFFPVNWLLGALPARCPSPYGRRDWALDPALAPGALGPPSIDAATLMATIRRRDNTRLPDDDLWILFDALPAPTGNDLLGNWRGKVVATGGWLDVARVLAEIPVRALGLDWGKRFFSPYRGDPLIFVVWNRAIVPWPTLGNVSMPEIRFRGVSGAAMTYDGQPWKDHFRVLDDGQMSGRRMMLGNWMSREKNGGWFTLEELPHMNAATADWRVTLPE
jgi:hypothetical protein